MSDGTRTPATVAQQRLVWRRLRGTLRPRATWTQVVVGLLCLLLGLSIAAQVRQTDEQALRGMSQQELVRLLDESGRHVADLEVETAELERTLESLRAGEGDDTAAQEAAQKRLSDLEILAGTAPAHGRGVIVTIADPGRDVRSSTVLSVIQELRNAGAEVIQVGQARMVASSSITTGADGRILVDGIAVTSPYTIRVIGDPAVMEPALRIPGGAADAVANDGGSLSVRAEDDVQIDAIVELREPEYSRVVK